MRTAVVDADVCGAGAELRLNDLSAGFGGTEIIRIDSLHVAPGEVVAIVGPSGCGKSTLLRVMAQLLAPERGRIQVQSAGRDESVRTGFVFQEATLLPWRTAEANIRLPGELEQSPLSADRVRQLTQLVGLSVDDLDKRPAALSGGMKMRVSLARALALQPNLLLLDEPFAAVDDLLRQQLQQDVLRIQKTLQLTTVLVTHNVDEAVSMSDRVITLGGSPATITDVTSINLNRDVEVRGTAEFARQVGQVLSALRSGEAG